MIDWLKVRSRPFLFSTSLTPADVAASTKAIELLMESTELNEKLWENANYLKDGLQKLGFDIGDSETPITPCIVGDEVKTQEFSKSSMKKAFMQNQSSSRLSLGERDVSETCHLQHIRKKCWIRQLRFMKKSARKWELFKFGYKWLQN